MTWALTLGKNGLLGILNFAYTVCREVLSTIPSQGMTAPVTEPDITGMEVLGHWQFGSCIGCMKRCIRIIYYCKVLRFPSSWYHHNLATQQPQCHIDTLLKELHSVTSYQPVAHVTMRLLIFAIMDEW